MKTKLTILSQGYNEFYNKCHDEVGRFCGEGSDEQFSSFSEKGRRRAADIEAGKEFKTLPKAKIGDGLDEADSWPEKWIDEKQRRTDKFAVPTFRSGEPGLQDPVSYKEANKTHNLMEISRKGKNGKEYLAPDTNHLTARMKAIGLDKVVSPKELSRMVREDKPVWVDEESSMKYRFYNVPKLKNVEIGVAVSKNGTIGTVIPGGYSTMAIQELGKDDTSKSQLGRLLLRQQVTRQVPSDETVTPTVPIQPVRVGKTTFRRP